MQIDKRRFIPVDAHNSLHFAYLLRQTAAAILTAAIINLK
jgi:hypothetical protein